MKPIIVAAFCVYPEIKSSEGIVNKNWIDIMNESNQNCLLLSAGNTLEISQNKKQFILKNKVDRVLKTIQKASKNKRSSIGIMYRILNRMLLKFSVLNKGNSLYQLLWTRRQKKIILDIVKCNEFYVFWARILPAFSVEPLLKVWDEKKFPFVVNVNDPIAGSNNENCVFEENLLQSTSDKAQCWTFPSKRLAVFMAEKYQLDEQRCFVIPHAMREQKILYQGSQSSVKKLKIIYTGTFYKSAFTNSFMEQLKDFCLSVEYKSVEFTFILSQFDDDSLNWIKESIPEAIIYTKLDRDEVLEIAKKADCMLVIDGISHQHLLKGKLIEAISFGLPIFSVSYQGSVMDKVVTEYGGFSAYQDIDNDIIIKLKHTVNDLKDVNWYFQFVRKRAGVMEKISEKNIREMTFRVSQYAHQRFLWQEDKNGVEPIPPSNLMWP